MKIKRTFVRIFGCRPALVRIGRNGAEIAVTVVPAQLGGVGRFIAMASSNQDKIEQLADDLKGSLDGGVDAIVTKIKAAQLFVDDQADAIDAKNQALKAKFVDFMRSAQDKGDALHEGMQQRISSWISEIDS